MNLSLKKIAEIVSGQLYNDDSELIITDISTLEEATKDKICFIFDKKYYGKIKDIKAGAVVVECVIEDLDIPQIVVSDVQLAFVKFLEKIFVEKQNFYKGVHPTVVLGKNVRLANDVSIGPYCVIGDNVEIKEKTVLVSQIYIGDNVKIGSNVLIYPNVTVRENVIIGNNVIIHSGAVVGSDGFGYIQRNGKHIKIPHIGKVIIEDNVEIGANVTIDRGTIGATIIKKGTKIDNLVHIAHNVEIGENVLLIAQVGIAGSSKIGDNTILAGQTGVIDHIKVGKNVIAGPRTGIVQDVEDNKVVWGTPPIPFEEQKKISVASRRLPKLLVEFSKLKSKVEQIEKLIAKIFEK
jgi:UDP-3-O-[3-hydroxymyristoyl] glucosamine N-acyltransferase